MILGEGTAHGEKRQHCRALEKIEPHCLDGSCFLWVSEVLQGRKGPDLSM
jgi:hypothetical protein